MAATKVAIVMGSDSDWPTLEPAVKILNEFGVQVDVSVISAHRTPEEMLQFAKNAVESGYQVIIAGAGGAAHLPGMIASATSLPVIGVPVALANLDGLDSLLSVVQMPAGIPVATVAINGAKNAGLLALRILAVTDEVLTKKLDDYRESLKDLVVTKNTELQNKIKQQLKP
ncbi:MAG: 5-(carboxyamino)imidazole ribonucleotide mutase [Actinobacteria bacterium]|nr:5-(carboxyamino)imidazole ribonucleotide mutase [Actinomycetota bacterium]